MSQLDEMYSHEKSDAPASRPSLTTNLHWEKSLKKALAEAIGKIVDDEIEKMMATVHAQIAVKKAEIISKAVERVRVIQKQSNAEVRFEVVISL